ncbi:MAG: VWA domain-containing protein [Thiohalocapsa sp.]|nr:VWA domain-containing protein [Thiohalocapsa sp.]
MVFYGQQSSPCGAVRQLAGHEPLGTFDIDLDRLPTTIERLVLCVSIDGAGTFGEMEESGAQIMLCIPGASGVTLTIGPAAPGSLRAMMPIELYRKDGVWRVRASADGFNGGLAALVEHFGGEVAEPHEASPAAPPEPARLSLEKKVAQKAPQLVSLAKKASVVLEKRRLGTTVCRVALVLDASGSMKKQFRDGRVQAVVDRMLPLAVHFDDDGALDCWAFASREMPLTPVTLDNVREYVLRGQGGWKEWMLRIGSLINDEPVVLQSVIDTLGPPSARSLLALRNSAVSRATISRPPRETQISPRSNAFSAKAALISSPVCCRSSCGSRGPSGFSSGREIVRSFLPAANRSSSLATSGQTNGTVCLESTKLSSRLRSERSSNLRGQRSMRRLR